MACVSLMKALW